MVRGTASLVVLSPKGILRGERNDKLSAISVIKTLN
jgi:hypothetical protein